MAATSSLLSFCLLKCRSKSPGWRHDVARKFWASVIPELPSILLEICSGKKCDGRKFYTNGCNSASGDRVMVLAFCTSSIGPLSIYQVPFQSLLYFQRYALDKLFTAKIEKGK